MSTNKDDIKPIGISDEWPYYMKLPNQDIQFGEWQLCPKCDGTGLLQPPYDWDGQNFITGECYVCNGAKILARPIIK